MLIPCVSAGVLFFVGVARATSFAPYPEQCIADSNGRYYVVVKRKDKGDQAFPYGPVTLTIAERREGSPPVRSASAGQTDGDTFLATVDARVRVRDGDIVHGRIELNQPPGIILVSSSGKGIVTLDVYGFNSLGPRAGDDDLVIYSIQGKVRHRKSRAALFGDAARQSFPRLDGCLSWLGNAWLDEKRGEVVIIGQSPPDGDGPPPILTVGFASGDVRRGDPDLIDRAISERNPLALSDALELARELRLSGSKASLPGIIGDEKLPLGPRLRAAVLLASQGDRRGAALVADVAALGAKEQAGSPTFERREEVFYAIRHSADLLGEDALPILKKAILKNGPRYSFAFSGAFQSLGKRGVPTLIEVLEDDRNLDAQLEAATCLGFIGPEAEAAVPALRKALEKKASKKWGTLVLRLDSHAAWALGAMGKKAKAAIPDLQQLAKDGDASARDAALRALDQILGGPPP